MKFHRGRDQRQALIKSLADSLVLHESIETTLPKAKAVARYTEKLVGKAKKGQTSLHSRRLVIAGLATTEAAHKLVDEIAPKLTGRNSGYFRVERLTLRRGDAAQMAKVSFVDKLPAAKKNTQEPLKTPKEPAETAETKVEGGQVDQPTAAAGRQKHAKAPSLKIAAKRVGRRGNR